MGTLETATGEPNSAINAGNSGPLNPNKYAIVKQINGQIIVLVKTPTIILFFNFDIALNVKFPPNAINAIVEAHVASICIVLYKNGRLFFIEKIKLPSGVLGMYWRIIKLIKPLATPKMRGFVIIFLSIDTMDIF